MTHLSKGTQQAQTENFKIDFIGIGAAKSATSWIIKCLGEHPDISVSKKKESHFFGRNYFMGMEYFKSLFDDCPANSIKGEFSIDYLSDCDAPQNIYKDFPNTKLIVCLRNPIERLHSLYLYFGLEGFYKSLTFEDIIKKSLKGYDQKGIKNFVDGGYYFKHIQKYLALFPRENILILVYEDIKGNPLRFMQRIYQFLGVEENFSPPSVEKKVWVTSKNQRVLMKIEKNETLRKIYFLLYAFPFFRTVLDLMKKKIKSIRFNQMNAKPLQKPLIKENTRRFLQNLYKKDTKNLELFLKRDLSLWR